MKARGDFVGGRFLTPEGQSLVSRNPARPDEVVLETAWSAARIGLACAAAADAAPAWAALSREARFEHLDRFRSEVRRRGDALADAILLETGKIRSEARGEVSALLSRFDLVRRLMEEDLAEGPVPGHPAEKLRYHPLGVVGVIGPFNYPLHLCHAYAIPALLAGNAVVIKPSEVTPLCAERYAEAAEAACLPPGVLSVVQGAGEAGAALGAHPSVRGLCFTGSYATGRAIREAALDRPELLVALEMGGKNTCVVLDDADVRQAAHEIVLGGYLTTGQRCTATDRVLVHRSRREALIDALRPMVASLRFGDPESQKSFAGPMTTEGARERLERAVEAARQAGAEALVPGDRRGPFQGASLHLLPEGCHEIGGYTDTELFGPDVGIETIDDDDEAIDVMRKSPFGFANSVFTASTERFERFYRETWSGILNRNRSTNLASPRLPFGGLGKSGNYRPGGAHAPRNVVAAVAVQENVAGRMTVHPQLIDYLPPSDLDLLESRHAREEAEEAARNLVDTPRPMGVRRPKGGELPESDRWLTRLYAGDRVVREKKPAVFDHLRSAGPWFVSVDQEPLSVLDGMSQTATTCAGFGESEVVKAFVEGGFGDHLVQSTDTSATQSEAAQALATELRHLVPGLPHVTFTSSGAEANEKALALCRLYAERRDADRVLAFEGSFHGRTLLALHTTYSPKKREPFEIAGYSATFAPYPVWETPRAEEPEAPSGFYAAAGMGDADALASRFGDAEEDPLLAAEVRSLLAVHEQLWRGEHFAVIIEPMQSEGGDRFATARFYKALRLLTRHHKVALIFDEVQTGFALGGSFAWHSEFRLVNFRGQPDYPDAVTFAKRAQVGVCMSCYEDPEPSSAQPASLVRGRIHAEMMSMRHSADRIAKLVAPRLERLANAFPHLVSSPRQKGYAFAFDLPSPEHLQAYLGQRFWRGCIVFGAGTRTVRYRLSEGFQTREIDLLFDTVRRSLAWLDAHPGAAPPPWEDVAWPVKSKKERPELRVRLVTPEEAVALLPPILDIEYRIYEPARRTPPADIRAGLEDPEGITTVAEVKLDGEWHFIGFAIGQPLEKAASVEEGPDLDPMLGRENTLYSLSLTVAPEYQGLGIGRELKVEQLREAARRRRDDGSSRYRYVSGRNRVGLTPHMRHLNDVFGAHKVCVLTGQYEDPEGQAVYYRIPLAPIAPDRPETRAPEEPETLDLSQGIARPLASPPESLRAAERAGLLYGPAVNKLTLVNYATPAMVRALEWVSALLPKQPHLYLTSSRDETVDKAIRIFRWHRPEARAAIGFAGGYVGHTTAAARSLSDPAVHRQGPAHFTFPRVPHPADAGVEESLRALRRAIEEAGGPEKVFALFFELCQERTGRVFPEAFWTALAELREELDLPLCAVETASACYRSGRGAFATGALPLSPDAVIWWGGGQTGYLHVATRWRVAAPLMMVSTWDGDELSLIREHHQLRAARRIDAAAAIEAMDAAAGVAASRGLPVHGLGLYRVVWAGERAGEVAARLEAAGLSARQYPGGRIALAPGLDQAAEAAARLQEAFGALG